MDLSTGDAIVIEKAHDHVWDWYADDKGVVRAGVAYAGRRWTVWYRDKAEEKLHAVSGKFANNDDSAVDKFIFRGENSWIMTNERTGRFALYKYDTKTGAIGGALFEHPEVDIDDALYDRATGQIKAVKYEDNRSRIHWLDPEMGALQAKLDSALPNSVNLVTDWSDDDQKILVYSASASDPGRYFLLDRKAARMHPVVDPYPRIDPAAMAAVKPVQYRTRDGLVLHAYLTIPRGRASNGLPLVADAARWPVRSRSLGI